MAWIIPLALAGCAATPLPVPTTPVAAPNPFQTTTAGDATVVAFTPPSQTCCPKQTLPQYLGITQCWDTASTACGQTLACLGFLFPGLGDALQPGPPLLPITDPANLSPDAPPAVQTAAKIKAEEDQAAQKIQALRYLATIGCAGCYPGVDDALIAALEDCTEEVRYEAVLAIRKTAGCVCKCCNKKACCSEKIQKKLREIAFETDDTGCPKEMSDRVRRQARLALAQCGPAEAEPQPVQEVPDVPTEGPAEGPAEGPEAGTAPNGAAPPADNQQAPVQQAPPIEEEDTTAGPAVPPAVNMGASTIAPPAAIGNTATTSQLRLFGPAENSQPQFPWTIKR
jgi:hypothetical protein